MTTTSTLSKQGEASTGVSFSVDTFSFDIPEMNAVITAYNTANNTNYPIWDTVEDNFEAFCHFLLVYAQIQNLALGNNTFNLKIVSINPNTQTYGTRGSLNSRAINVAFPFSTQSDVWGDSDSLG